MECGNLLRLQFCSECVQFRRLPPPKPLKTFRSNCSTKAAADPDSHTRECALKCQARGFGILTKDHRYLKFDVAGNTKITEALKSSDKKDHLRVDVSSDVEGDTLQVSSIKLL
jgi:hypothetical protein